MCGQKWFFPYEMVVWLQSMVLTVVSMQAEDRPHALHNLPAVTGSSMLGVLQALPGDRTKHEDHRRVPPFGESNVRDLVAVVMACHLCIAHRSPARRICELVPAEESAQPAFQIMRRDRPLRGRQYSQP